MNRGGSCMGRMDHSDINPVIKICALIVARVHIKPSIVVKELRTKPKPKQKKAQQPPLTRRRRLHPTTIATTVYCLISRIMLFVPLTIGMLNKEPHNTCLVSALSLPKMHASQVKHIFCQWDRRHPSSSPWPWSNHLHGCSGWISTLFRFNGTLWTRSWDKSSVD